MSVMRNKFIEEHINKNYPDTRILNFDDPDSDFIFYSADELQAVDDDWFPLCCYKDNETKKLMYGGRKKIIHTYTDGETGAGKTTRFVMQSIRALSSMKTKPSFVIVDIHGEIIENLYNHLKQNGYNIKILNCDNPQRSDTYNPFCELTKDCLATRTISNDAINRIRKISEIIQPIESAVEPIWEKGSRSYTNGCILDKFEDLINGELPEDCLTLYNVLQNHYWLRAELTQSPGTTDLLRVPHYKRKGINALSVQKIISVTNNADRTRASYYGVIENNYDAFGQPSMYFLSSNNTIDITEFVDTPTAIVIQSGSTKIGDNLISLLVNEIYTYIVKQGKNSKTKKLPRNIHCFLDEFANCNIADGNEFIKMLTTSRKFGMFWHMILQSDAQVDRKFDSNIARIIRANSTEIFMGSNDFETTVRFAKSCGQKTIEALSSFTRQQDPRLEIVDLMTTEKLNLTEEGYVYIKSHRHPLTKSFIEAFYNCSEFVPVDDIDIIYPYNDYDYKKTAFYPSNLPPVITSEEYDLLKYIKAEDKDLDELEEHFNTYDIKNILKSLALKGAVSLLRSHMISVNISEQQFDMYKYNSENGFGSLISDDNQHHIKTASASDTNNTRMNLTEIDKWLNGTKSGPDLLDDIRKHLDIYNGGYILNKLKSLTCVPEFFREAIEYLMLPKKEQARYEFDFPDKTNTLKFEIIEEFIKNNNFKRIEEWEIRMRKEYDYIKNENLYPDSIIKIFSDALKDVLPELSLSEIRHIKKMVS